MKLCDIFKFYSELGGGLKTSHQEKMGHLATRPQYEYILLKTGPAHTSLRCLSKGALTFSQRET